MPSRSRSKSKGNRMSAIQLLSFQSNLYSQTDLQPKHNSQAQSSLRKAHLYPTVPLSKQREAIAIDSITEQKDKEGARLPPQSVRPHHRYPAQRTKLPGEQKKKWSRVAEHTDWQDGQGDGELNWQQASLLKSKRLQSRAKLPAWASISKGSTTAQAPLSTTTKTARRGGKGPHAKESLPPLRFSSGQGKAAWQFVLPTAGMARPSDLPRWYDSKVDDLVVTLGIGRSPSSSFSSRSSLSSLSSLTASSYLDNSTSDLDKHEQFSEGDSSFPFDAKSAPSYPRPNMPPGESSCDSLHDSISKMSIYAGPHFSAAAPEACSLPTPSFLNKC